MRKIHKGLLIGGVTLAVLVPASVAAADQIDTGDRNGRGNGSMLQDCTGDQAGDQIRARDGTGAQHAANSTGTATPNPVNPAQHESGPMDGTGNQWGSRR